MKCKYCGKPYKFNENIDKMFDLSSLSIEIQEKLKYIPDCECLLIKQKQEFEKLEKQLEKERLINRVKKYKDISIIDTKLLKSTFDIANMADRHMNTCKRYADKFIQVGTAPAGMLLYGPVGTGKTFASACIANYLMQNGKTVLVMNLGLYLIKLKLDWDKAENEILTYVKDCDLLIIDDLGVENMSEFVLDKVFALIDTRYRAEKPLIITTNLTLRGEISIEKKFGVRVADRIEEMCYPVKVTGESKRKSKFKNEFLEFIA